MLVILCLLQLSHANTHSVNAHHFLFVTFHISLCVSSTHSNNALVRLLAPSRALSIFLCILHTQYKHTHTSAHTNKYLMPVRPTESNVRTMIGIRLQVVSIIMIAAFNPYAHHKSNFISSSSNSMLLIFTFYLDAAVAAVVVAFISERRLPACLFCFAPFCTVCFAVL